MNQKGVSNLVAVVLIILITVFSVSILWIGINMLLDWRDYEFHEGEVVINSKNGDTYWDSDKKAACVQVEGKTEKVDKIEVVFDVKGDSVFGYFYEDETPAMNELKKKCFQLEEIPSSVKIIPIFENDYGTEFEIYNLKTGSISNEDNLERTSELKEDILEKDENEEKFSNDYYNLFVSLDGDDENDGSEGSPFRSFDRMEKEILKIKEDFDRPINVYFREGIYFIDSPLEFDEDFSGEDKGIVFQSYPGENAIISGGKRLETEWNLWKEGIYVSDVDESFRQLYVEDERRVRARSEIPGEILRYEYARDENGDFILYRDKYKRISGRVIIGEGDYSDWDFSEENPLEMHLNRKWAQHILRVDEFLPSSVSEDADSGEVVVSFLEPENTELKSFFLRAVKDFFFFENSIDLLDSEGEWFLDTGNGKLYYKPFKGEDTDELDFYIPLIENILIVRGSRENKVENIEFRNLEFRHSTWMRPSDLGYLGQQSGFYNVGNGYFTTAYLPPSAISLGHCSDVVFDRVVLENVGGIGFEIGFGSNNFVLKNSLLNDIASNGVVVCWDSETKHRSNWKPEDERDRCSNILIYNNFINGTGQDYYGTKGIFGGFSEKTVIKNNELSYMPYTGIGWGWHTHKPNDVCRDNEIVNNEIHHVMTKTADGGAIYTRNYIPNTLIKNNYVYDIDRDPYSYDEGRGLAARAGFYLDDQSEGVSVIDNIAENVYKFYEYWGFFGEGCRKGSVLGEDCVGYYHTEYSGRYYSSEGHEDIVENAGLTEEFDLL